MSADGRVALVTGATQGLGLALIEQLAERLNATDTVYLTGRNEERVNQAVDSLGSTSADLRGAVLDVGSAEAAEVFADEVRRRHGGLDIVFNNAVMRVGPADDPGEIVDQYTEVNNFGTTRCLRAFSPLLRNGGRFVVVASSLGTLKYLAPVLHDRFDGLGSLDDVDEQVAAWRDAVRDGSARGGPWPGFVNIPSKIGQVSAVRALAQQRRAQDAERDILLVAVCPGMMNTPTSSVWWDVSDAPTPADAATTLIDLVLAPTNPGHYGNSFATGRSYRGGRVGSRGAEESVDDATAMSHKHTETFVMSRPSGQTGDTWSGSPEGHLWTTDRVELVVLAVPRPSTTSPSSTEVAAPEPRAYDKRTSVAY